MLTDVLIVLASALIQTLSIAGGAAIGACISTGVYLTWGNEE